MNPSIVRSIVLSGAVVAAIALAAVALVTVESVQETEHCVRLRYGRVDQPKMPTGMNFMVGPGLDATCFNLVEQNWGGKEGVAMEAPTNNPLPIKATVRVVYQHNGARITGPGGLFTEKRTPERAEQEVDNAIRAGFATAMKQYSVTQLFSPQGVTFDQTVRTEITKRLGDQTLIKNVFVTDLNPPEAIAAQRVQAAQQELALKQAQDQLKIDSAQALGRILKAEAAARETKLNAEALASSPEAIRIRIAEVTARGLSEALRACTSNCFLGGDVMTRAMVGGTAPLVRP
jgi:regulator of protease activity HflC (stomatin/prohibitin superfamily)